MTSRENTNQMSASIDWACVHAAIWRSRQQYLRAVKRIDTLQLGSLLGIERQKRLIVENTERFISGKPANNALLWGARGTGKSSIIKALLNAYAGQGLRVIQIDKEDLLDLPEVVDQLVDQPYHFIVFCDDLSFEEGDATYKALKSILEGSIELPPENVLIYATSNRRHLMPEYMSDNEGTRVVETELHYAEAVEEKISLSDRFGLWLSFYSINQNQYLAIVDQLFGCVDDPQALHAEAIRFATSKGGRSGRAAQQFYKAFSDKF